MEMVNEDELKKPAIIPTRCRDYPLAEAIVLRLWLLRRLMEETSPSEVREFKPLWKPELSRKKTRPERQLSARCKDLYSPSDKETA